MEEKTNNLYLRAINKIKENGEYGITWAFNDMPEFVSKAIERLSSTNISHSIKRRDGVTSVTFKQS